MHAVTHAIRVQDNVAARRAASIAPTAVSRAHKVRRQISMAIALTAIASTAIVSVAHVVMAHPVAQRVGRDAGPVVGKDAVQDAGRGVDRDVEAFATRSAVDDRRRSLAAAGCRRNNYDNPAISARPQSRIRTGRHAMKAVRIAGLIADPIAGLIADPNAVPAAATPLPVPARSASVRLGNVSPARAMHRGNAVSLALAVATRATATRLAMTRCSPPPMKALCIKLRWGTDKAIVNHSAKVCLAKLPRCSRAVRVATKDRHANRSSRS